MTTDDNQIEPRKVTVRFVTCHATGRCWFEEKMDNGSWVMIPSTEMMCEGNSRSELDRVLEQRRQVRLRIHRTKGPEEHFTI